MLRGLFTFFGAISLFAVCAAQPTVDWTRTLAPPSATLQLDNAKLTSASDGGIFVHGTALSGTTARIAISKMNSAGARLWSMWLPVASGTTTQEFTLRAAPDGGAYALYRRYTESSAVLLRLSGSGAVTWRREISFDGSLAMQVAGDGSVFVADRVSASKFSAAGLRVWLSRDTQFSSEARETAISVNGDFVVLRVTGTLVIYRPQDGIATEIRVGGDAQALAALGSGNIVVATVIARYTDTSTIVYRLSSFSPAGAQQWQRDYAVPTSSLPNIRLVGVAGGGVLAAHIRDLQTYGDVAAFDPSGNVLWSKNYFRFSGFVQTLGGLYGLRYDVTAGFGANGFFPINVANGNLGTPGFTTTSSPAHELTAWITTGSGLAAVSSTASTQRVLAIQPTGAVSWTEESASLPVETEVDNTSCLMPKLALSSPSRVASFSRINAASPVSLGSTSVSGSDSSDRSLQTNHCTTAFSGTTRYEATATALRAVDAAETTVWSAPNDTQINPAYRVLKRLSSGDLIAVGDGFARRFSPSGVQLWQASYAAPVEGKYFNKATLVAEAVSGDIIVAGTELGFQASPWVIRLSSAGGVLNTVVVANGSCYQNFTRFAVNSASEVFASYVCNETAVVKFSSAGTEIWKQNLQYGNVGTFQTVTSLVPLASGGVVAGGCFGNIYSRIGNNSSRVSRFSATGSENWTTSFDTEGDFAECVSSMVLDPSGRLQIGVGNENPSGRSQLLTFDVSNGRELSRSSTVFLQPKVKPDEMLSDGAGGLFVLGADQESPRTNSYPGVNDSISLASLRRVALGALPTKFPSFFSLPITIDYGVPFSVSLGLVDAASNVATATSPTELRLRRSEGGGRIIGVTSCTVAVGASSCTLSNLFFDAAESNVTLLVELEGSAAATSAPIYVRPAATQLTVIPVDSGPYTAFDFVRVQVGISSAVSLTAIKGTFATQSLTNCVAMVPTAGYALMQQCTLDLRVNQGYWFSFYPEPGAGYAAPASLLYQPTVAPTGITLTAGTFPSPNVIVGSTFHVTASLTTSKGRNLSGLSDIGLGVVSPVNAGCFMSPAIPSRTCSQQSAVTGVLEYTVSAANSASFLGSPSATFSVNVVPGLAVTGALGFSDPNGFAMCASEPGADCEFNSSINQYYCALPTGWRGTLYAQPGSPTYFATPRTISIDGQAGVINRYITLTSSGSCSLDADGNGVVEAMTDGLYALRAMLNLPAPALAAMPFAVCSRRNATERATFVANQISTREYDVDGDGVVLPATDGLLILRGLLGFQGDSLVAGALGVSATRRTGDVIRTYLQRCGGLAAQ